MKPSAHTASPLRRLSSPIATLLVAILASCAVSTWPTAVHAGAAESRVLYYTLPG